MSELQTNTQVVEVMSNLIHIPVNGSIQTQLSLFPGFIGFFICVIHSQLEEALYPLFSLDMLTCMTPHGRINNISHHMHLKSLSCFQYRR